MAVSPNFTTTNTSVWFWLQVDLTSQDVSLNRSYVRIRIWAQRTAGYETYGSGTATFYNYTDRQYIATIYPSQKITSTPVCLFDQNHYVNHDAAGNASPSFGASFNIPYVVGGAAQYHTFPLPQIQRAATITSVSSGGTFGSAITVNWSGNAAFTYQVVLYGITGGEDAITLTAGASECVYSPVLDYWMPFFAYSNSTGINIELKTLYNGSQIGASSWSTLLQYLPASAVPSVTAAGTHVDIFPADPVPTGWGYVQTRSGITITATAAGAYGSTITAMTIGGGGYSNAAVNVSNGAGSRTFGALNTSGTNTFIITATDTRGRSTTITEDITVNAYARPQLSGVLTQRATSGGVQDSNGTYALGKATYTFSAVGSNAVVRNVNYRESGATTWTDASVSFNSGTAFLIAGGFDILKSYEIVYIVDDQFNTVIYTDVLSVATPILHFKKGGLMAAIFKRVGTFIGLDIGADVNIDGDLTVAGDADINGSLSLLSGDSYFAGLSLVEYSISINLAAAWTPGSNISGRKGEAYYDTGVSYRRHASLVGYWCNGWDGVVSTAALYLSGTTWNISLIAEQFSSTTATETIVVRIVYY